MDAMLKESLEGFDSLWKRVSCQEPEQPAQTGTWSLEDALLRFIHDETCAGTYAAALARMFQGEGRAALQRHAAEAKAHVRRLRAEYFIATGLSGGGNEDCRGLEGKLPALRSVFLQAGALAERYEAAAERTDCPELREMFQTFASHASRRARETRALLVESF